MADLGTQGEEVALGMGVPPIHPLRKHGKTKGPKTHPRETLVDERLEIPIEGRSKTTLQQYEITSNLEGEPQERKN
jgi:hypothetical protein